MLQWRGAGRRFGGGEVGLLPCKNEPGPGFNQGEAGEDDPVHEPWGQLGRIRGTKGLVGGEDWEEYGDDGSSICKRKTLRGGERFERGKKGSRWGRGGATIDAGYLTHESRFGTISNKPMISNRQLRIENREQRTENREIGV